MLNPEFLRDLNAQLSDIRKRLDNTTQQPRSEYTGGVARKALADFPSPGSYGRILYDLTDNILLYDTVTRWTQVSAFPVYTVASLPTGYPGQVAFASNGRKGGEGAGAGTGVPVFWNSLTSQWLCFHDNSVVAA